VASSHCVSSAIEATEHPKLIEIEFSEP